MPGTIIVGALLAAWVTVVIVRMIRRRKGGCSGNCGSCPHCH